MIAQGRKVNRLTKQFLFDVEEDRPQRSVVAILHLVTVVQNEIRDHRFQQRIHDASVNVMARSSVAIGDKGIGIGAVGGGRRLEGPPECAGRHAVIVFGVGF